MNTHPDANKQQAASVINASWWAMTLEQQRPTIIDAIFERSERTVTADCVTHRCGELGATEHWEVCDDCWGWVCCCHIHEWQVKGQHSLRMCLACAFDRIKSGEQQYFWYPPEEQKFLDDIRQATKDSLQQHEEKEPMMLMGPIEIGGGGEPEKAKKCRVCSRGTLIATFAV